MLVVLGWDYWETAKACPPITYECYIGTSQYVYWETVGDAIRKGKDTPRFIEKHKEMKLYS